MDGWMYKNVYNFQKCAKCVQIPYLTLSYCTGQMLLSMRVVECDM